MQRYKHEKRAAILLTIIALNLSTYGCTRFLVGAGVGAAGAGAAYELSNKKQMDELEKDYKSGNITKEEYESRKKQIEKGSTFY